MTKRIVLSDMHFGDPDCSLNAVKFFQTFGDALLAYGPVDELILAGDILDTNISTFNEAICGKSKKLVGLKSWITDLFIEKGFVADKIIYIPGNHDYRVWDMLATQKNFIGPVSEGQLCEQKRQVLMEDAFMNPFINGIAPKSVRDRLVVCYPDHEFPFGKQQVLITHGHYIDTKQTRLQSIEKLIEECGGDFQKARKLFFQYTAQYQAIAHSVSYVKNSRESVEKWYKGASSLMEKFDIIGKLRNKPIDKKQLKNIERYLLYYRGKSPDIFIFGHTHEAGHCNTASFGRTPSKRLIDKVIDVWNTGTLLRKKKNHPEGTFLLMDDSKPTGSKIQLLQVNSRGVKILY